jgi:erythromycin esterase
MTAACGHDIIVGRMRRTLPAFLALLLLITANADAASKRRAVRPPANPDILVPQDPSTVPGWLRLHGHTLSTTAHFSAGLSELEPLRNMIGDAKVVGLGDATHGTHEFYAVKLRILDFLVREMNFDALLLEAPVPQFARLNEYVLGGNVDVRAVLNEAVNPPLGYVFLDSEEIVSILDWMRTYNLNRGDRPPVQIFGSDNFGQVFAWQAVVAYLRTVDAGLATMAETEYACVGTRHQARDCAAPATRVHDALVAAQANLIARSSRHAFYTALYNARTVVNGQHGISARDEDIAENVSFVRENLSATGRVVVWGHNAHVSRVPMELSISSEPAGHHLAAEYGDDYFVIATMTGSGSFYQWNSVRGQIVSQIVAFNPVSAESHEAYLGQRGSLPYLLSLRGELPEWLNTPRVMNTSAAGAVIGTEPELLPAAFDAIVYIPRTTPLHLLP